MVQEKRTLRPVERITVEGSLDLSLRVVGTGEERLPRFSSGGEAVLWIEATEDLLGFVEHEVDGNRLVLRTRGGVRLDPPPSLELTVRRLTELEARGRSDVILDLGEPAEGSPPLTERLALRTSGSVDVRGRGSVAVLDIQQLGSGDLRLGDVRAGRLHHSAKGSGTAWVHVEDTVDVELLGSCDLHLAGPASIERQVTRGSCEVIRPTRRDGAR